MVCKTVHIVKFKFVDTDWIVFASTLLVNTAASLLIASLFWHRPPALGRKSLVAMLFTIAIWNFGYAMITLVPELETKRLWLRVKNIGILLTPIFWFLFTIQYTLR